MKNKKATIAINGKSVTATAGCTILDAAKAAGISIPTLCHHPDLCDAGVCRICVVEVDGVKNLQPSCVTPVQDGMEIKTHTRRVRKARKNILELLLSEHYGDCNSCNRSQNCELQTLAQDYGVDEYAFGPKKEREQELDKSSYSIVRDKDKCIQCGRCIRTCQDIQGIGVFQNTFKGEKVTVDTFFSDPMMETLCINCGQCINRCPTAALQEKSDIENIWDAIDDPNKHVVIQTAPAPRAAIGECFGAEPGTSMTKKLNTAIRQVGFDKVFDTNFTADLTIMEEGTELLLRLKKALTGKGDIKNATLPMITSCSPGWVKYCEHYFESEIDHLSTCKSPQQMFGAIMKTYYAEKTKIDPKNIVSVSLMPCTAKKYECNRPEMNDSGYQDVDYSITTRELAQMIKQAGISLLETEDSDFDHPLGLGSGAGLIFGATGGVMEAAIRTAYELVTGREVPFKNLEIIPVRGMDGIKEAELTFENVLPEWDFLEGVTAKVAIAHGLANAKKVLEKVEAGTAPWHFIEVMACPGGCLGGGGQPVPTNNEIRTQRAKAIYQEDRDLQLRKSHENKEVQMVYEEYFHSPCGHKSHELLHTHYKKRGK